MKGEPSSTQTHLMILSKDENNIGTRGPEQASANLSFEKKNLETSSLEVQNPLINTPKEEYDA